MLFLTTKLWDRHYENDCIHCVHFLEKENWTSDRLHNLSKLQTSNLVMSSPPECLLRINPSELNRNKKWACLCSVALSCWGLRCPWTEKESSVCAHAKWDKYQGISGHWSPRYPPIQIHCSRCVLLWIRFFKKKKNVSQVELCFGFNVDSVSTINNPLVSCYRMCCDTQGGSSSESSYVFKNLFV